MAGEIESVSDEDAETLVGMGKAEYTKKTRKKTKEKWFEFYGTLSLH